MGEYVKKKKDMEAGIFLPSLVIEEMSIQL